MKKELYLVLSTLCLLHGAIHSMDTDNDWQKGYAQDLIEFVRQGDVQRLEIWVDQYKVNLNVQDENGLTPLMAAVQEGNLEMVEYLIDQGADVLLKNKNGQTAIDIATQEGQDDIKRYLLRATEK